MNGHPRQIHPGWMVAILIVVLGVGAVAGWQAGRSSAGSGDTAKGGAAVDTATPAIVADATRLAELERIVADQSEAIAMLRNELNAAQEQLLAHQEEFARIQDPASTTTVQRQLAALAEQLRVQRGLIQNQQINLEHLQQELAKTWRNMQDAARARAQTPAPAPPRVTTPVTPPARQQTVSLRLRRGDEQQVGAIRIRLVRVDDPSPADRRDEIAELQVIDGNLVNNIQLAEFETRCVAGYELTADEVTAGNRPGEGTVRLRVTGR